MSAANVSSAGVLQLNHSRVPLVSASAVNYGHLCVVKSTIEETGGRVNLSSLNSKSSNSIRKSSNIKEEASSDFSPVEHHHPHRPNLIGRKRIVGNSSRSCLVHNNQESSAIENNLGPQSKYQEEFNKIRERLFRILSKVPIQVSSGEQTCSPSTTSTSSPSKRHQSICCLDTAEGLTQSSSQQQQHKVINREPLIIKYYNERSLSEILELHFSCSLIKHNYHLSLSSSAATHEVKRVTTDYLSGSSANSSNYDTTNNNNNCSQIQDSSSEDSPFMHRVNSIDNHNQQHLFSEVEQQQYQQPSVAYLEQQQQQIWPESSSTSSWPAPPLQHHQLQQPHLMAYNCHPSSLDANDEIIKQGAVCSASTATALHHRRLSASHNKAGSSKQFASRLNGKGETNTSNKQSRTNRVRNCTDSLTNRLPPEAISCSQHYRSTELQVGEKQVVSMKCALIGSTNGSGGSSSNSATLAAATEMVHFNQQFRDSFRSNPQPEVSRSQIPIGNHYTYLPSVVSGSYLAASELQHQPITSGEASAGMSLGEPNCPSHLVAAFSFASEHHPPDMRSGQADNLHPPAGTFAIMHAGATTGDVQQPVALYELEQQPVSYYQQAPAGYQQLANTNWSPLPNEQQQAQQMIDQSPPIEGGAYLQTSRFYSAPAADSQPSYATTLIYSNETQTGSSPTNQSAQTAHELLSNKWNHSTTG